MPALPPSSPRPAPKPAVRNALHAIAVYEALKGLAALAVLVGAVDLMHHDVRRLALELIGRFNLDPEARYPSLLLHYADMLPGLNLHTLVLLGAGYVLLRLVEAYGLWFDTTWGEELAALSGALYIPFEVNHLWHRPSAITAAVLVSNLLLVGYLAYRLWSKRRAARA